MKRTPLRPVSKKKAAKNREWQKVREAVERRSNGVCEAQIRSVCLGTGSHGHHVRRRSQGGSDDPSNVLWVCALEDGMGACHGWIHDHPLLAARMGLLWSRREEVVPHPSLDLAPCVCGQWSRVVPCYRCELEDDRVSG